MIHHHWKESKENTIFGETIRLEFYSTPFPNNANTSLSNKTMNNGNCDVELDKDGHHSEAHFNHRWCGDRSGSNAIHLCEWFGVTRCAAIFLTRQSSLLRGWSTSAHPSPSDRAKV